MNFKIFIDQKIFLLVILISVFSDAQVKNYKVNIIKEYLQRIEIIMELYLRVNASITIRITLKNWIPKMILLLRKTFVQE